jgi:hypothetical protein
VIQVHLVDPEALAVPEALRVPVDLFAPGRRLLPWRLLRLVTLLVPAIPEVPGGLADRPRPWVQGALLGPRDYLLVQEVLLDPVLGELA